MRRWPTIALVLPLIAGTASGQTPCDDALAEAQKSYDLGRFEQVAEQLQPCLETRLSKSLSIQVHSLLARAYLMNEEPEKARAEVSTILRLDSTFDPGSTAPRLAALVAEVRRAEQVTQVASVSKTNESLREAPATVVVITAEEIQRRGYLDLEQLLHDLPGFDISRLNGDIYSNIYQRGYRSPNDRLLLLVDGVEQNELSSGILYLSRQYPLTNIDRVEVIYGPASTMYGANAYTGVISILTREPEKLAGENRSFAVTGQVTAGGYEARAGDVTVAGRDSAGTVAWSVAMNFQQSRERDLSAFDDWDYAYRNVNYQSLPSLSFAGTRARNFRSAGLCQASPYYACVVTPASVGLTAEGVEHVRALDRALVADHGLAFDDRATNWSLYAKARIANLTVGVQSWRSEEGVASQYRSRDLGGTSSWTPRATSMYFRYSVPLERMKVNVFTRYNETGVERDASRFDYLHNYASTLLGIATLVPSCQAAPDPKPAGCQNGPSVPWVEEVVFGSRSNQIRAEVNAAFEPTAKLAAVSGFEVAKSSIQSQLTQDASGPGPLNFEPLQKPSQIEHTDLAVYGQVSWQWRPSLKLVGAARVTHNQINAKPEGSLATGFGTLFTPRAAVIYAPLQKRLILKAIYSEAFKDPTDAQKFGAVARVNAFVSEGLAPEKVSNMELSAGWEPTERMAFETSLYQAQYSDVVDLGYAFCPNPAFLGCYRYQNRDAIRIRGMQSTARYQFGKFGTWANYTYTDPILKNPKDEFDDPLTDDDGNVIDRIRVADIARNRLNVGIDARWNRWNGGLRAHYTGARKTERTNPFTQMDAHTTVDASLAVDGLIPRATLQLTAYNLLDEQYYDAATNPLTGAPRVLQAGRTVYLRIAFR